MEGGGTVLASPRSKSSPQRQQTRDANHSNNNKAADHGERIFVDPQHTAPHRDVASDQSDCRRLGSKFLWLQCNDPIFYGGKETAEETCVGSKVAPRATTPHRRLTTSEEHGPDSRAGSRWPSFGCYPSGSSGRVMPMGRSSSRSTQRSTWPRASR